MKSFQEMLDEYYSQHEEELKKAAIDALVYGSGAIHVGVDPATAGQSDYIFYLPKSMFPNNDIKYKRVPSPLKINYVPINGWDENNEGCNHSWKEYRGFTESYKYCEKCDKKA